MAAKHWMAKAFANAHGQLRKSTHTAKGKNISREALHGAVKKGGLEAKRAQLVLNAHPLR
jgi:hypothetical protein